MCKIIEKSVLNNLRKQCRHLFFISYCVAHRNTQSTQMYCTTEIRIRAAASNYPPSCIYTDMTVLTDAAKDILVSTHVSTRQYPAEPASLANLHIAPPLTHIPG